jgi:hypothetical protein
MVARAALLLRASAQKLFLGVLSTAAEIAPNTASLALGALSYIHLWNGQALPWLHHPFEFANEISFYPWSSGKV